MTKMQLQNEQPYEQCTIKAPDGEVLCICSRNKINWYLKRGLAVKDGDSETSILLTFEPKGRGNSGDDFYLIPRENICVVCGTNQHLTKHHIVPRCYRSSMPEEIKNHASHDVVLLCFSCHETYERKADVLKEELAIKYKTPRHNSVSKKIRRRRKISGYAHTILKYDDIPQSKLHFMVMEIEDYIKKKPAELEDLERLASLQDSGFTNVSHGDLVMRKVTDLQGFIEMWRKHFVDSTEPEFLPFEWDVKRSIYNK